jgi:hypothetical protein
MIQKKDSKMKQQSTCDQQHRIRVKHPVDARHGYLCCDSRQCMFKVEMAGRFFCLLDKPDDQIE